MLGSVNAREERLLRVVVVDQDGLLGDDRPAVERVVDEMNRDARYSRAGRQCVAHWMSARERGQQAGMDVEYPTAVARQRLRAEHAHEACEHDPVDPCALKRTRDRGVPCRAVRVDRGIDQGGRNVLLSGKAEGIARTIGEYERDL